MFRRKMRQTVGYNDNIFVSICMTRILNQMYIKYKVQYIFHPFACCRCIMTLGCVTSCLCCVRWEPLSALTRQTRSRPRWCAYCATWTCLNWWIRTSRSSCPSSTISSPGSRWIRPDIPNSRPLSAATWRTLSWCSIRHGSSNSSRSVDYVHVLYLFLVII